MIVNILLRNEESSWSMALGRRSLVLAIGSNSHRISVYRLRAGDNETVGGSEERTTRLCYPFTSISGNDNNIPSVSKNQRSSVSVPRGT